MVSERLRSFPVMPLSMFLRLLQVMISERLRLLPVMVWSACACSQSMFPWERLRLLPVMVSERLRLLPVILLFRRRFELPSHFRLLPFYLISAGDFELPSLLPVGDSVSVSDCDDASFIPADDFDRFLLLYLSFPHDPYLLPSPPFVSPSALPRTGSRLVAVPAWAPP